MTQRFVFLCILCILAWMACATFVIAAAYLHYVMGAKDVVALIIGAVASGSGGSYLVHEILYGPNGS